MEPLPPPAPLTLHLRTCAPREADGCAIAQGWSVQLCLGAAGRELDAAADACALELGDAAERHECVDVRVYRAEAGAEPSLFGAARVALLALGLGDAPAAPAWRESWLALHRRQQCVGSIRLAACLAPRGTAPPEAPPTPHRSYEAMVAARQHAAWEAERSDARAELVRLVRGGGIPASLRASAWLSVSGARHKKRAAEPNEYEHWVEQLRSEAWREDHTLSTQLHTIRKDLPRTFPDDNIFANSSEGRRCAPTPLPRTGRR